ncbi:MAG TPA: cytochrome c biogenesis protein CcdA [Spirochaetota bacterium]|nr:cytochrome c biogenesis protein CcdA [Spirochaetota bacterium]
MLDAIFTFNTEILSKNWYLALLGSFIWGILSIILSPCHLSSIPLLIAYISGQGKITVKKAFVLSLMFAVGILITIGIIGLITGLLGKMLGNIGIIGGIFSVLIAIIFFIVGLNFLGVIPSPDFLKNGQPNVKGKGLIPAFLLGLLFGVVLGPCTFGFMAPVLGIVFGSASKNIFFSIIVLLLYAIGHCLVIIFAGTFTEIVEKYLNWNEKSNIATIVKKVFGVIMILIGIYLILSNFKLFNF